MKSVWENYLFLLNKIRGLPNPWLLGSQVARFNLRHFSEVSGFSPTNYALNLRIKTVGQPHINRNYDWFLCFLKDLKMKSSAFFSLSGCVGVAGVSVGGGHCTAGFACPAENLKNVNGLMSALVQRWWRKSICHISADTRWLCHGQTTGFNYFYSIKANQLKFKGSGHFVWLEW